MKIDIRNMDSVKRVLPQKSPVANAAGTKAPGVQAPVIRAPGAMATGSQTPANKKMPEDEAPGMFDKDRLDISEDAKRNTNDFQSMLEEMRNKVRKLAERL